MVGKRKKHLRYTKYIKTRGSVFHQDFQTPKSGLKKDEANTSFLTHFEEFGYLIKHSFEFLI